MSIEKIFAAGTLAFAALAIWVFFLADGPPPAPEDDLPAATVDGAALQPADDPQNDPAVGQPAPRIDGYGADRQPVTLADSGPAILVFLAHWCPICQDEVPELRDWYTSYDGDVQLAAIATSLQPSRSNYPASSWLERERFTVPTVYDTDGTVEQAYGITAYPAFVLIDRDGNVTARLEGAVPTDTLDAIAADLGH